MEPSVNQSDLRALTLVGPPRITPNQNPLAVLHLDNRQGIITSQQIFLKCNSHQKTQISIPGADDRIFGEE